MNRIRETRRVKLSAYRDLILKEAVAVKGFMALLMKGARVNWSEAEMAGQAPF